MHDFTTVVALSRWQFAITALYHYLFVPLTLGLSFILATMETVYVVTGRPVYRDMVMFWTKLFAINFALGVATGLTMEFEFGTNWATYSHFVGDIFGAPLAIEGLMAFFMESTFVGLMLFGWDRMSRVKHLLVTFAVAVGTNLSALWILIANSYMQDPRGSTFDPATMRNELQSFMDLVFSSDAQAKFVHTSIAGYVTAAVFVLGISAFYLLRGRHVEIARRSIRIAAVFGVFASIAVISMGDALGFIDGAVQPTKLVAMEALWKTEPAPTGMNLVAIPDQGQQRNLFAIKMPWVLSPLVTHSFSKEIPGADQLEQDAVTKIQNGIPAVEALEVLSEHPNDSQALAQFNAHREDLGYGMLVQRYAPDVSKATPADIERAARDTIPPVWPVFWSFRLMITFGFGMLAFFVLAAIFSLRNQVAGKRWFLKLAFWLIPVPFLANEVGWLVAELGRQPWTVYGQLPTWVSASTHSVAYMVFSLTGFVLIYSVFIVIEMYLMVKFIRRGPESPKGGDQEEDEQAAMPIQFSQG